MAPRSRPRPIVPERGPAGEDAQVDQRIGGTRRSLRDLVALALILATPTILILVGNVGAAVLAVAAEFIVVVLRAWWQHPSDPRGDRGAPRGSSRQARWRIR